jgi:hypothetical protein
LLRWISVVLARDTETGGHARDTLIEGAGALRSDRCFCRHLVRGEALKRLSTIVIACLLLIPSTGLVERALPASSHHASSLSASSKDPLIRIRDQAVAIRRVARTLPASTRRTTIIHRSKRIIDQALLRSRYSLLVVRDGASVIGRDARGLPASTRRTNIILRSKTISALANEVLKSGGPLPGHSPPAAAGYFGLSPVGSWSSLPDDSTCASMAHRSTWEIRPENNVENKTMPDPAAVHASFAARPVSTTDGTNRRWDTWLLPRVDGHFTGTTDEIFQWAACKWGLPDDLLRGIAVQESTWYEFLHFTDGSVYSNRGSGDYFSSATTDSEKYCNAIAAFGHDYQNDTSPPPPEFASGLCPRTFSIVGIMSWQDPSWGQMQDNQNGTFPFSRDSTAFALDYIGAQLRGCYEGWETWLTKTSGDIWGCVGAWYSGDWHSSAAEGYISDVKGFIASHEWLTANFANGKGNQYHCDPMKGCPI